MGWNGLGCFSRSGSSVGGRHPTKKVISIISVCLLASVSGSGSACHLGLDLLLM